MASKVDPDAKPDSYLERVKAFPLRPIRGDDQLDAATAVLHQLLQEDLDEGGRDYFEVLARLVHDYEEAHHRLPDASEAEVLRLLLGSHGLSQAEFAKRTKIAPSTVSAVLQGGRSLTREQVIAAADFFAVKPAVFMAR